MNRDPIPFPPLLATDSLVSRITGITTTRPWLVRHGYSRTSEYKSWRGMMERCYNDAHKSFPRYGGRGIDVCIRWHEVEAFVADMGQRPPAAQIDRINNDAGYSLDNCRWATPVENSRNRSSTHFVEFRGERASIAEWSERLGVNRYLVAARLQNGWSAEMALTKPSRPISRDLLEFNGTALSFAAWERRLGLGAGTLRSRLDRGWPLASALSAEKSK